MRQTGTYGWLFQRVSGAALFVLVVAHFILTHFMGFERRLYDQVVLRLSNPLWQTFDLLILFLALSHGLYGVWGIAGDYIRRDAIRIAFRLALATACVALFTLGAVTILSVRPT